MAGETKPAAAAAAALHAPFVLFADYCKLADEVEKLRDDNAELTRITQEWANGDATTMIVARQCDWRNLIVETPTKILPSSRARKRERTAHRSLGGARICCFRRSTRGSCGGLAVGSFA